MKYLLAVSYFIFALVCAEDDKPTNVKVIANGIESFVVTWDTPSKLNGDFLYYTMYYRKEASETESVRLQASNVNIGGLKPNVPYEFWATISTKKGEGKESEHVFGTLSLEAPAKVITEPEHFHGKLNLIVTLPCKVAGARNVTSIIWKVNGQVIEGNERQILLEKGKYLDLIHLRHEDANNYTCIATNPYGSDSITHQETHINRGEEFHTRGLVNGYNVVPYLLSSVHGIATYVRNDITDVKVLELSNQDYIFRIVTEVGGHTVTNIYKPPNSE
ncbi:Down syndrome cell adhesion molecule-like protein Dscam2 [Pseudolycoriella hygida]|uniref:Down syndrome cell adhesion molecule-like protein Dscam2 n=1 Tax=Pseudolycoriella hygida TaxID=35572 RepID=A0A9Q0MZZ4_9DIPT|nr:Down syndrome cell adhesion molecule-like protein Dscam2 [Pseudolycoriella hygida]